jgi:hypothetical protein
MSLPGPPIYVTVGDSFVNARPFGADPVSAGMLVKSQTGPTVYIADSATSLIPLRSFDSVAELGLPTPYSTVSDATIATMTTAPAPLSNLIHCGSDTLLGTQGGAQVVDPVALGTLSVTSPNTALCALIAHGTADTSPLLVKSPSAATIYLIDGGLKRPIASGATFLALSGGTYYTVNGAYLATVPTGTTLP